MIFREATVADIPQIQVVRHSVKENMLSNPSLVTDADCEEYITRRGKGWVCEIEQIIVGFAIADIQDNNIWALFVHPECESRGIGKKLHDIMLGGISHKARKTSGSPPRQIPVPKPFTEKRVGKKPAFTAKERSNLS